MSKEKQTVRDIFNRLNSILCDYNVTDLNKKEAIEKIEELKIEAEENGLDLKITSDIIEEVEIDSSYLDETSYEEDVENSSY